MVNKIRILIARYCDVLTYLVFGVLTTIVNYLVYIPLYNHMHFSAAASNILAWCTAVLFAYLTNKPFVFRSHNWSLQTVLPEFGKFVGCRIGSGALETGILFFSVDLLGWNGNLWKLLTSVLVVVLNYIASKWIVFKKNC